MSTSASPPAHAVLQQEDGTWRTLAEPAGVLVARTLADVLPLLAEVESATRRGLHAAGFVAYEAAPAFDAHLTVHPPDNRPLAWFLLGRGLLPAAPPAAPPPTPAWRADTDAAGHAAGVRRIRELIAAGETYQVNYTFRQHADAGPDALAWQAFPLRQPHGVGACFTAPEFIVASASPELFFARAGDRIVCRPMKGTAARGRWSAEDAAQRDRLCASAKDRAENVMIVDMVRNDLGRVARGGTVRTPRLFDIERYPTVWQMTSTVEAETSAPLPELFQALFPSASVTGAPKVRTMQIIRALETSPRGLYTGAAGWVGPGGAARFNVAIRTAWVDREAGQVEYGTGSGIVWDSDPAAEHEECLAKTRVLGWSPPDFSLLETLAWRPDAGYVLLAQHLQRLADSAAYFGFRFDRATVEAALASADAAFAAPRRVRLLLDASGAPRIESAPLSLPPAPPPFHVQWASHPMRSADVLLYHKTTDRHAYDAARASCPGADDALLWNERGELTESTIANVAVRLGDAWYTPPLGCGLLPGVMRAQLLGEGRIRERTIRREELARGAELALFNSVRGWWPARLAG